MDSASKLAAMQNVIRNKFEQACKIRLENENDVNSAMDPLAASLTLSPITNDLEAKSDDFSKKTINSLPTHLAAKSYSNHSIKTNEQKENDPNTLCDILRTLLASPPSSNGGDVKRMQQINAILDELRKQEIM